MQAMTEQNERLIKASSDQANASSKSASVADSEKQAVLDSAQAAKDSASATKTLTDQNKELVAAARTQANASQASARAAETQAGASKSQANSSEKMVGQNERIVKAAEIQAGAAQTTAAIGSQLTVGFYPKLVSLTPKSNLAVSIAGGAGQYIFTEKTSATATYDTDAPIFQPFDLGPQWEGVAFHIVSRKLTEEEVRDIKDGKLNAFVFLRFIIKDIPHPLEGCYFYNWVYKELARCENVQRSGQ
jgi:hypothetical protein